MEDKRKRKRKGKTIIIIENVFNYYYFFNCFSILMVIWILRSMSEVGLIVSIKSKTERNNFQWELKFCIIKEQVLFNENRSISLQINYILWIGQMKSFRMNLYMCLNLISSFDGHQETNNCDFCPTLVS